MKADTDRRSDRRSASGFMNYLRRRNLPYQKADVHRTGKSGATIAMVQHAPADGIEYAPVDDLIISVILRSAQSPVVRDIGEGVQHFQDDAGKVVLTPPGCASYWQFASEPTVLHLSVPHDQLIKMAGADWQRRVAALRDLAQEPGTIPLVGRSAARLWTLGSTRAKTKQTLAAADLELDRLLTRLLEWPDRCTRAVRANTGLSPDRLDTVLNAVNTRDAELSVNDLARLAGLSPDHFCRAFRASTGLTPHQMLSQSRIEAAKLRLQDSEAHITTIAMDLGFSSSAHFSSRFRELTGLSPSKWREVFGATAP